MTDKQQTSTLDHARVTMGKPNPTSQPHTSPAGGSEPNFSSELDVLAAVAELEKKYGKKILSEEQRKSVGGVLNKLVKNKLTDSEIHSIVTGSFDLIQNYLPKQFPKIFTGDDWNNLTTEEQQEVRRSMFGILFGTTPEQFKLDLYKKMGGDLGI